MEAVEGLPVSPNGVPAGADRALQMDCLLAPRSIAVVGASQRPSWGRTTLENLRAVGYEGHVFAVNPRYEEVATYPCFPSISELPVVPDAAVFALPAVAIPHAVGEAIEVGVRGGVVYASGFGAAGSGEGGDPGEGSPRAALDEVCARKAIALLGPNCLGLVNYARRTALFGITMTYEHAGTEEGVALIAQSGNMALNLSLANRGIRLTHLVSCGNQLDVTAAELLEATLRDPSVRCVALLLEGIPDVGRFSAALTEAAGRDVPVVVLKVGQSERGRRATIAHTGSLAGSADLYRSFFRQFGAVQVEDLDELVATCAVLSSPRRPSRPGVAVFASSGGECGLVSDVAEATGVLLPDLPPSVRDAVTALLPDYGVAANPLDITAGGWGDADLYAAVVEHLASIDEVGAVVSVADWPTLEEGDVPDGFRGIMTGLARGASAVAGRGQLVAMLSSLGDLHSDVPPALASGGVVPLCGLRAGLTALAHAGRQAEWRSRRAGGAHPTSGGDPSRSAAVEVLLTVHGPGPLDEDASKEIVARYGLATPERRLVVEPSEAALAAAELGYPVVLKLSAETLHHKSDVGGVVLGLRSAGDVEQAARRLLELPEAAHGARLLVERQVQGGLELILGGRRDEVFGPTVTVGIGGVMTEVLRDSAHRLAPVSAPEASEMLFDLRSRRLLQGFRGSPGFDLDELASAISRFSYLVAEHERILELDVNPLVRDASSGALVALDALIVLA